MSRTQSKREREEEIGKHLGAAEEGAVSTAGAERTHPSKGKESPGMDPAGSEKREMAPKACGGGGKRSREFTQQGKSQEEMHIADANSRRERCLKQGESAYEKWKRRKGK